MGWPNRGAPHRQNFAYPQDAATLHGGDYVLDPDELVGVRLYDEGGALVYAPALYLLPVSNVGDAHLAWKLVEAAVLGLSLGACTPGAAAAEATGAARIVAVCDRAAVALGVATSLVLEHRSWVLSRFGEDGRAFLFAIDVLNSALAFYGGVRVAMAGPGLVKRVRSFYADFAGKARLQRQMGKLTSQDASRLDNLEGTANGLLDELAAIRARRAGSVADASGAGPPQGDGKVIPLFRSNPPGGSPEAGVQPMPSEAEESLAPTGTDGPAVALRGQGPADDAPVASAKGPRRGGPSGDNPGPSPRHPPPRPTQRLSPGPTATPHASLARTPLARPPCPANASPRA